MLTKKKGGAMNPSSENITTIIAEGCVIEGPVNCKDHIKIDGHILGEITSSGGVILGQTGIVRGNIKTKELIVFGKAEGDVYADNLSLKGTGVIIGNIQVQNFQVENGAVYKGTVSMDTPNTVSSSESMKLSPKENK